MISILQGFLTKTLILFTAMSSFLLPVQQTPQNEQVKVDTPVEESSLVIPIADSKEDKNIFESNTVYLQDLHSDTTTNDTNTSNTPNFLPKDHEKLKRVLVNIYCDLSGLGIKHPLTASGVIIDSRGIILTTAHVAQYVLLENYLKEGDIKCVARTGSPAINKFPLKILYISPAWIEDHKETIFSANPIATGEDDYGFLLIKNSSDSPIFRNFEFVLPETSDAGIEKNSPILLGAYPADILDPLSIEKVLYAITHGTTIKEVLTFSKNKIDAFSTGGSYLAQKGSSGGAVINKDGRLIGIFVTSTQEKNTDDRDLRAITMSHIERSLREFGGVSIWELLGDNVFETSEKFSNEVSPLLAKILIEEIRNRQ